MKITKPGPWSSSRNVFHGVRLVTGAAAGQRLPVSAGLQLASAGGDYRHQS